MKGSRGKRVKAATRTDKVGTVGKPQVEEPRLRCKPKVDFNEEVLAFKGVVEKKLNKHGSKRKNVIKGNKSSEDRVESSKCHLDMKSSKAVRRPVLKRKTDVDHDAQSLVGSDHAERQQQKTQKRSYPDELKREIAEKVAEKGNMSEVARIYSTKLGFPVNKTTIRGIKIQVEQWDEAEKGREIQEDEEDMVAYDDDDDERSNEDDPFQDEAGEKRGSQDESDEEDTDGGGDNSEAETEEEEGTNEGEGLLVQDETDGEAGRSRVAKAMKGKEGEDEPEVEVTFDTTAFVETPLTEGCKKIRQLEMEMKKVEKNEELLKMKKAAYARELLREQEKQLMLLKKTLAVE